ncbi:2Fe-2S iron-sulfur cluster-binding protein [Parafrankia sp. BMG5.11]|uniref:2Fe-2S iron-sulfur cluster-binding protein n=1 Tax=Parafrankia sp. BMG5.11 TaxID=222540 RepID=UPI0035A156E9
MTVEPSGIRIEVHEKESVAAAAWRQGITWPTKCWGQAECMSCFTKIVGDELAAEPMTQEESDAMRLRMAKRVRSPPVRLACRLHVEKDGLVLEKRGVRTATGTDNNMTRARQPTPESEGTWGASPEGVLNDSHIDDCRESGRRPADVHDDDARRRLR